MPWLFERKEGSNIGVDRIHSQDNMMITWNYQHLMDIAVANCGRPMTAEKLRMELQKQLNMVIEDMMESYELCEAKMIEEINKDYVDDSYIFKGIDKVLNKDLLAMDDIKFGNFLKE